MMVGKDRNNIDQRKTTQKIYKKEVSLKRWLWIIIGGLAWTTVVLASEPMRPKVSLETSKGLIIVELDAKAAPQTVKNFMNYVREGYYNGTIFHRVIPGFMIQGGGLTPDLNKKNTHKPIPNEAGNGLKNQRGTIAMARTMAPHSATSQFFINLVDNEPLNHQGETPQGWGYCVFGKVVDGIGVVDAIAKVPTTSKAGRRDVPETPVVLKKATVMP
jgi:cyclophilin family peptidyl-prolyl cis-trans isomerase